MHEKFTGVWQGLNVLRPKLNMMSEPKKGKIHSKGHGIELETSVGRQSS